MKRTKLNQPPESVIYTGDFNNDKTIIEVFSYNKDSIKFKTYGDTDFKSEKVRTQGADYLYYVLLDALVDNQLEILASIGDEVDEHEQFTIEATKVSMDRLFKLRKQLLLIRAAVVPFKDIMVELQSEESEWISSEVKIYLSDVSDHVNHVNDLVVLYREMVNNIYEINMLTTGNKLNHIMAVLTVFTALFIPLNFMTGFYGMNFTHFPAIPLRYRQKSW